MAIRLRPAAKEGLQHKLVLTPRGGYTVGPRAKPTLELELIYGHACPTCNNVVDALAKCPKPIGLWPYEETVILSQGDKNLGEILKIFPDDKARPGQSCYEMQWLDVEGGMLKLRLRNHVARPIMITKKEEKASGETMWEVGERPCYKAGIVALREETLVKDFMLYSGMQEYEMKVYDTSKIKLTDIVPEGSYYSDKYRLVPAVGKALPMVLIERSSLIYGFKYDYHYRIAKFRK